jgi:uncharacterized YccA/Bax inhibitor family protein
VQSSNPVLGRLGEAVQQGRSTGYGAPTGYSGQPGYPSTGSQQSSRMMTLDDVVVRTVALLALTGITGAISWVFVPQTGAAMVALLGATLAAFVLGLVITFMRVTNPLIIGAYAVLQGGFLGVASRYFEQRYPGIVVQAVLGTFGVFAIMAVLYKARMIRATPRFTRIVIGAMLGIVMVFVVNLVASLLGYNLGVISPEGSGEVGWFPIAFTVVCIIVGALTFILDFDAVEQGVRHGLPERYSWYCAFGLLAGLIFLYWQILRLLSYLRR